MKNKVYVVIPVILLAVVTIVAIVVFSNKAHADADEDSLKSLVAKHNIHPTIYKSPQCGCCEVYLKKLQKLGVTVKVVHSPLAQQIKDTYKIPVVHRSCHLVTYGDYFVEGHVPFEAVQKLLKETPPIGGIALGGMPSGSVGMPGKKLAPFEVMAITDGQVDFFGSY